MAKKQAKGTRIRQIITGEYRVERFVENDRLDVDSAGGGRWIPLAQFESEKDAKAYEKKAAKRKAFDVEIRPHGYNRTVRQLMEAYG